MRIGDIEIPCYVLNNGMRVITHRGLQAAISMSVKGSATETAEFIGTFSEKGLECSEIVARLSAPTEFVPAFGRTAFGYEATVLADICDLFLEARSLGGILTKSGERIAARCELLARGFARVGIIALVDEATGYQLDRCREDLQRILEQYISKELARWVRTFDQDFYKHMYRLRGWTADPTSHKRPSCVARYTVDLTYARIHPSLLESLKSSRTGWEEEGGSKGGKLHQFLTPGEGHPRLKQHLEGVIVAMKLSRDWKEFYERMNQLYPKLNETMSIPFPDWEGESGEHVALPGD